MEFLSVSNQSQTPIYQQLYEQISSQILNGILTSDTILPSIRGMAKELRVSIITIKKTWELLERNNYIYTVAGKGSYVMKNTKKSLEKKRQKTIKNVLEENVNRCKQMGMSEEELLIVVSELYNVT
ncbi:HTH-type transcriptional repressor YtrA [Candidatus Izimaplasma bacterium HR1]|uniref:GntR family transcriptional regulator n=1 Tax=Candidatus Izimoplasma sp. HR1 TaxID=1541959 RepID=UPI0004F882B3|nr:HTH-type transcriptional repressor YtrA [Candidatus Izimaplasma bacterium HR1]